MKLGDRATLLTLALIAAAFLAVVGSCAPPIRVVTTVVPYVAVLTLDSANHALGSTSCDLNGQPIIYLNSRINASYVPWVLIHERIHVEQLRAHPGGCAGYAAEYSTDEGFRLRAEAEAFCGVYHAQLAAGRDPAPALDDIVTLLTPSSTRYRGHWTKEDVQAAMSCWKEHVKAAFAETPRAMMAKRPSVIHCDTSRSRCACISHVERRDSVYYECQCPRGAVPR